MKPQLLLCLVTGAAVIGLTAEAASVPPPLVTTPAATYAGRLVSTTSGRKVFAFSGIRYAKPLTELQKLEESTLPDDLPPGTVLKADKEGPDCMQVDPIDAPGEVSGEEDCLFLNIYTPNITTPGGLPVMFWIHGGAWRFGTGSSRMYGPQTLLNKDVVLVTINYRLGPIGFSSLEDEIFPGNLGLKDQRTALRWVNRNIRPFGGDPDRVTIFGQSAGAASVHFHMISPHSSGLFHQGISQSGTALSPWALDNPGVIRGRTFYLAKLLNCTMPNNSSREVVKCLQKSSAHDIVEAQLKFDLLEQELVLFRPVVEPDVGKNTVVTSDPWVSASRANVPWMTGVTSSEAAFFGVLLTSGSGVLLRMLDIFFDVFAPTVLMFSETSSDPEGVTRSVRDYYLKGEKISAENLNKIIQMLSDAWFVYPSHEASVRHNSTLFSYYFDHKGKENIVKAMGSDQDFGVSHGDDIPYLFRNEKILVFENGSDEDRKISDEMAELWTNFATYGKPGKTVDSDEWQPWSMANKEVMHIDKNRLTVKKDIVGDSVRFWETLPVRDVPKFKKIS